MSTVVYVIHAKDQPNPCKVGVADDVSDRLCALQCGNPQELVIHAVRAFDDKQMAFTAESRVLRQFAESIVRGEWIGADAAVVFAAVEVPEDANSAAYIIRLCGGAAAVAEMTGTDVSRVHRWTYSEERGGTGGTIPMGKAQILLNAAKAKGIPLKPEHFFGEVSE